MAARWRSGWASMPRRRETNAVILGGRAYFKADSAIQALGHVPRWRWVRRLRDPAAAGARLALRPHRAKPLSAVRQDRELHGADAGAHAPLRFRRGRRKSGARETMTSTCALRLNGCSGRTSSDCRRRCGACIHCGRRSRPPAAPRSPRRTACSRGLICWFAGLPRPGRDIDVSVVFAPKGRRRRALGPEIRRPALRQHDASSAAGATRDS